MSRKKSSGSRGSCARRRGGPVRDYTRELHEAMRRFLPARGLPLIGSGRWSDRLLIMAVLLMVFSSMAALQDRFFEARSSLVKGYLSRRRPGKSYAGFIAKLRRNSSRLLTLVSQTLQRHVRKQAGDSWKVGRHLAFGADGTKSDAPRTQANQEGLKIGGKKKSGPQQLVVSLMHIGSGLLWSWRKGVATASERGLLCQQLGELPAGSLLLLDAGFTGYELLNRILSGGHGFLVRAGANVTLLEKLGWRVREKGELVYLWPDRMRQEGKEPLVLRQIVITDGRNRQMSLLTSLLEEGLLSFDEAAGLYQKRWGIELMFRGLKQTLGRRKMLSDSPENAQVELDWTLAGYWMLSLMLWEQRGDQAAVTQGIAGMLRLVRQAMAGFGDRRSSFMRSCRLLKADLYTRTGSKKARDWPHKKKEPPCGTPHLRMATPLEVKAAKRLLTEKEAA